MSFQQGLVELLQQAENQVETIERLSLYDRLIVSNPSLMNDNTLNVSLKREWFNSHLEKFGLEEKTILQNRLKSLCPNLLVPAELLDLEVQALLKNDPETSKELIKEIVFTSIRQFQIIEILGNYLGKGLEGIQQCFDEMENNIRTEVNNKVKNLQNKVVSLEKLLKSVKESGGKGPVGLGKSDKELEKLKIKLVALEKQNHFLVSRGMDLEHKLRDVPSEKTSMGGGEMREKRKPWNAEESAGSGKEELLMFIEAPAKDKKKSGSAGIKKPVKKVVVSKQEKNERFETNLMEYCSILSACINAGDRNLLYDNNVYEQLLELVVEFLPKADKKKDLLYDKSGFFKGMLELVVNLLKNRHLVRFSDEQMWVGKPDLLPINFKPKSKFWMKILDPKTTTVLNEIPLPNKPPKFVVQEAVSKQLQNILISFVNFIRLKLTDLVEKTKSYKSIEFKDNYPKQADIRGSIKKIRELLGARSLLTKTVILCYMFITRIAHVSLEQKVYFDEEISEMLNLKHWGDFPAISAEIQDWYKKIGLNN